MCKCLQFNECTTIGGNGPFSVCAQGEEQSNADENLIDSAATANSLIIWN